MTWFIETINRVGGFEKENCSLVWKGLEPLSLMTRSWWYLFVGGAGSLSASCHRVPVIMTHPCHDGSWASAALRDWSWDWRWQLSSWHCPDTQSLTRLSSSPEPAPSKTEHWAGLAGVFQHSQAGTWLQWLACAARGYSDLIKCRHYLRSRVHRVCSTAAYQLQWLECNLSKELGLNIKIGSSEQRSVNKCQNSFNFDIITQF